MPNWRIFPNTGGSYLQTAAGAADGTLSVYSGTTFPAPPGSCEYSIRVDDEFMRVTGVSGNTLAVTRAQEGSTAVAHAVGALVFVCITRSDLEAISHQCCPILTSGTPGSGPPFFSVNSVIYYDTTNKKLLIWDPVNFEYRAIATTLG